MERGTGIKEMRIRPNDARTRGTYMRRSTAPPHRAQVISSSAYPAVATHRVPCCYPLRLLSRLLIFAHYILLTQPASVQHRHLSARAEPTYVQPAPHFSHAGSPDPGSWTLRTSEHQGQRQGKAGHLSAATHVKLSALAGRLYKSRD
jgi:hypothetical protein